MDLRSTDIAPKKTDCLKSEQQPQLRRLGVRTSCGSGSLTSSFSVCSSPHCVRGGEEPLQPQAPKVPAHLRPLHGSSANGHVLQSYPRCHLQVSWGTACRSKPKELLLDLWTLMFWISKRKLLVVNKRPRWVTINNSLWLCDLAGLYTSLSRGRRLRCQIAATFQPISTQQLVKSVHEHANPWAWTWASHPRRTPRSCWVRASLIHQVASAEENFQMTRLLVCVLDRHQEELRSPYVWPQGTKETRDGVWNDHPSQDEACGRERLCHRWDDLTRSRSPDLNASLVCLWNLSSLLFQRPNESETLTFAKCLCQSPMSCWTRKFSRTQRFRLCCSLCWWEPANLCAFQGNDTCANVDRGFALFLRPPRWSTAPTTLTSGFCTSTWLKPASSSRRSFQLCESCRSFILIRGLTFTKMLPKLFCLNDSWSTLCVLWHATSGRYGWTVLLPMCNSRTGRYGPK